MKTKKLELKDLVIKSFVTLLPEDKRKELEGGYAAASPGSRCDDIC